MVLFIRRLGTALVLSLAAAAALAQQPLTLSQAQALAISRSEKLVASSAAAAAVREQAVAAGQLPDPVLKLGIESLPVSGPDRFSLTRDFMTMRRIGVMQELTGADKRRLKVERLVQDGRRVEAERLQSIGTIRQETALAWIERRYGQAMLQLIAQQLAEAGLQVQGAELAFRAGHGSQADVFSARAAVAGLQDRQRQVQRQVQGAGLKLARWVGAQAAGAIATGDVPWQATPVAGALQDQLARIPAVLLQEAQVAAAEVELRQARANTRPDVTVEAMYSQRGPAYSNMVSIGLSVPLPLNRADHQDRETAASSARLADQRARYQDVLAAEEAALRVLVNDWEANKARLARLSADLLPAAKGRTEAAVAAYRGGRGDLAAVLAARQEELDARMQVLALEMETARLWAQLHFLVPTATEAAKEPQ